MIKTTHKFSGILAGFALIFASTNTFSANAINPKAAATQANLPPETISLQLESNAWNVVQSNNDGGRSLIEMIPRGQELKNWQQLISIAYVSYKLVGSSSMSVEEVMKRGVDDMKHTCPDFQNKVLSQNGNDITYEWQVKNCQAGGIEGDQIEIAKIVKGDFGYNSVHYSVKADHLSPEQRDDILKIISTAEVVKNKPA